MDATQADQSGTPKGFQNNYIVQAWLVLILALCFGVGLAGVQMGLGPKIEANKLNETREKVPELVLGAEQARQLADQGQSLTVKPHSLAIDKQGKKTFYSVYEASAADGQRAGWVIKTAGQGYADKIELLVGLDAGASEITGLFVLEQKETPGLGNKIITTQWRNQFLHKKTDQPLVAVKTDARAANEINAVTGATISSKSVCSIINAAVQDLQPKLADPKGIQDE